MAATAHFALLFLLTALAAPAAGASPAASLSVEVMGSLGGADDQALPTIFADAMGASSTTWRFAPELFPESHEPNRIEWRLTPAPDASGGVRSFGFSRGMMNRLVGSHSVKAVDARLYLGNTLVATVSGQLDGNARDPDVAKEIVALTQQLIAAAPNPASNGSAPTHP